MVTPPETNGAAAAEGEHVTAEIQRITGLEYKFFTQCVVLPQGRFAEFLHAQPRERQDLLVQLLDAEVYERIRQRAVREEDTARQQATFARNELNRLAGADEATERAAAERYEALKELSARITGDLAALLGHDRAGAVLRPALVVLLVLNLVPLCLVFADLRPTLSRIYTRSGLYRLAAVCVVGGTLAPLALLLVGGGPLPELAAVLLLLAGSLAVRFVIIRVPHAIA